MTDLETALNMLDLALEDLEAVHLWLDDQHAPRYEGVDEIELSIVGRIIRMPK